MPDNVSKCIQQDRVLGNGKKLPHTLESPGIFCTIDINNFLKSIMPPGYEFVFYILIAKTWM